MPAEAKKPEAADDGRGAGSIERDDDADMVELVGEGQADDKQAARQVKTRRRLAIACR